MTAGSIDAATFPSEQAGGQLSQASTVSLADWGLLAQAQPQPWLSAADLLWWGALLTIAVVVLWLTILLARLRCKHRELLALTAPLHASYDVIKEGMLVVDQHGRRLISNRRFHDCFGHDLPDGPEELLAALLESIEERQEFEQFWKDVSTSTEGGFRDFALRGRRRFITVYSAAIWSDAESGRHLGRLWSFEDVTARKELESSLRQSQKMEAIGRLAGGIAHDFNNLLMAISGNLELSRMFPEKPIGESAQTLEAAELAIERAAKLVRNLLGFSRQSTLDIQVRNANQVVERLCELLRHTLNPGIELKWSLANDLWLARLDETQLQQVLLNLCLNARDALRNARGTIHITTENASTPEGEFIKIIIADNGVGMSREVQEKIFEPFFTTKPMGHGTGLGLAMSYGIIRQHDGFILCKSSPNQGTEFTILLPRGREGDVRAEWEERPNSLRVAKATAKVLLGEDSELVRESCAAILRSAGYRVTPAANGREVIAAFEAEPDYDVAILDLSMPIMSGPEAFVALRALDMRLPIVVCSGYTFDVNEFIEQTGEAPASFVQKPFRKARLLAAVQGAIASSHAVGD